MNILDFMRRVNVGALTGYRSLIDGKQFLVGERKSEDQVYTLAESESRCMDHVERLLRDQDSDQFNPALTLAQRQELWRVNQ